MSHIHKMLWQTKSRVRYIDYSGMRVCRAVFKARLFFWKPPNQCGFPVSVHLNIDTLLYS